MQIISSREFRSNLRTYFDRIDQGEEIIVQRKGNKSYKIVPIQEDDTIYSLDDLKMMVTDAVEEYKAGRTTTLSGEDEIKEFLDAL